MSWTLVIGYSGTGKTLEIISKVLEALKNRETPFIYRSPSQVSPSEFIEAKSLILITPTYLDYMPGELKSMFDRLYYDIYRKVDGKPTSIIVTCGEKESGYECLKSILHIAKMLKLKVIDTKVILEDDTPSFQG
ncbi:hypothetical protein DRO02_02985 [archaeon]|nr:MAG: hypothetical protein DRO21_02910 [archaeon]RLG65021.1 MAG: hypothetical protein DRO02_02985 [archaeon]HDM23592.1 flavodoxin family protein [Candidatus Bathyarchaeota archaeon]